MTTSYQTTCTVSDRTFNKRQHANARYSVESPSHFTRYDMVAARTQPWRRNRMDVSQCQLLEEKDGEGKAAKAARLLFGPPAAPVQGKGLGPEQRRGALDSCGRIVLITYGEGSQDNCIKRTVIASTAEPSGTNWQPHGDKECFSGERRHCQIRWASLKLLLRKGLTVAFRASNCSSPVALCRAKFKCMAVIWDNRKACQSIQVVSQHLSWQGNPRHRRGLCH